MSSKQVRPAKWLSTNDQAFESLALSNSGKSKLREDRFEAKP